MVEKSEINSLESLSKQKLLREIENIRRDSELKAKELERKFWRNTSVIVGLIGVFSVLVAQIFLLINQTEQYEKENTVRDTNFRQQIILQKNQFELSQRLERKKYKGEILIKAFDGKDTTETKKRILFLIDNHIIDDQNDTLRRAANNPNSLPSSTPTFNKNSSLPTVTITNASLNPCSAGPVNGCWQTSERGRPGDVIAIQVLFHNSSSIPSKDTKILIDIKRTKIFNQLVFIGSIKSSTLKKNIGMATLLIQSEQQLPISALLNGSEWYTSVEQQKGYLVNGDLFNTKKGGFNIGTVPPGGRGILIARFEIAH